MGGTFSVLPARLVKDPALKAASKAVAAVLGCYADEDGYCWPARATIATHLGVSIDTVDRALAQLVDAGYLEKLARSTREGDRDSNGYLFRYDLPTEEAIRRLRARGGSRTDAATPEGEGVAAPVRRGSRTDAATGSRTGAALTIPVGTNSSSSRKATALRERLGEHASAWDALELALRTPASREAMASSLLLALDGGGTVSRPITPADLAAGILTALSQSDRPSDRFVLGCAVNAATRPAVGVEGTTGRRGGTARAASPEIAPLPRLA